MPKKQDEPQTLRQLIVEQTRDRAASRRGPLRRVKPDDESENEFVEEDDPADSWVEEENADE